MVALQFEIEGRNGPGHYIIAWRWNGYYDCTDIDLFDEAVDEVYGVAGDGFVWNRIDHCLYLSWKAMATSCYEVRAERFSTRELYIRASE